MSFLVYLIVGVGCFLTSSAGAPGRNCVGACDEIYNSLLPCHCDQKCAVYGNCCEDYFETCNITIRCSHKCATKDLDSCNYCSFNSPGCLADDPIYDISVKLWNLDIDRLASCELVLNPSILNTRKSQQGGFAEKKLFSFVDERVLQRKSFKQLRSMMNDYKPEQGESEDQTFSRSMKQVEFISRFMETEIGKTLYDFLKTHNKAGCGDMQDFKKVLGTIWFENYSRKTKRLDSSGFEYVFVGETRKKMAYGMHNWVRLYEQEKLGAIDYTGYVDFEGDKPPASEIRESLRVHNLQFSWNGRMNDASSFVFGVSPDWEFAVSTLCHLTRPDVSCPIMVRNFSNKERLRWFEATTHDSKALDIGLKYISSFNFMGYDV